MFSTDCSKVFVDVGLGVNVEFKTKDAVVWIDNRLSEITKFVFCYYCYYFLKMTGGFVCLLDVSLIAKNEIEIERLSNDPNATAAI